MHHPLPSYHDRQDVSIEKEERPAMNFDDELSEETNEIGSDELLSDDTLHLPESASPLVRVHAVRAWLTRRQVETNLEIGEAALALQDTLRETPQDAWPRRRMQQEQEQRLHKIQQELTGAQQRLSAYEEAQALLEECISHTTSGERSLVEYYLMLENLLQESTESEVQEHNAQWQHAFADVQHRIEQVSSLAEE